MKNKYTYEETKKFLTDYCDFSNPDHCYVLMAAARNKLNPSQETNRERLTFKVIRSIDRIDEKLADIERFMGDKNYYLYVSVNARSAKKATLEMTKRCLDLVQTDDYSAMKNPFNLINKIYMNKRCKADRGLFRFDVDVQDEDVIQSIREFAGDNLVIERETQNGVHMLVKPMDIRKLHEFNKDGEDVVSSQPDALVFVNSYFNGEEV